MEIIYDLQKMVVTFPAYADEPDFEATPPPAGMRIDFERQHRLGHGQWCAPLVKD